MELFRSLKNGNQYNSIIPSSQCKKSNEGNGDTDFSVKKMVEVVKTYHWQMKDVATLLKKQSLADTVASIHDFAFWHFQYLADDEEQQLRSPACSWQQRHTGIDCKSYTIIASCLLTEMKISHLIRKVNYTDILEAYSHVYVVVPTDQKQNNLNKGYYIIDGTLQNNEELDYITAKDYKMQHSILNKPNNQHLKGYQDLIDDYEDMDDDDPKKQFIQNTVKDMGAGLWGQTSIGSDPQVNAVIQGGIQFASTGNPMALVESVRVMLPKVGLTDILKPAEVMNRIKDWMNRLKCIGGSMMNEADTAATKSKVGSFFLNLLNHINQAASDGDLELLSKLVCDYKGMAEAAKRNYYMRTGEGFNYCSRESLYNMELYCLCYEIIGKHLKDWLSEYYTLEPEIIVEYHRDHLMATGKFPYADAIGRHAIANQKFKLIEKKKIIHAFEITEKIMNALPRELSTLDALVEISNEPNLEFVSDLARPIAVQIPVSEIKKAVATGTTGSNPNNSNTPSNNDAAPKQAGFGIVGGILLLGAAYAVSQSGKTTTTKKAKI
jgi:hypothetical protein